MNLKLLSARVVRMAPDTFVSAIDSLLGFPRWAYSVPFSVPEDPEPPYFIIGCGRSGNTLLRNLLCRGYDTCIPPEIPGLGNTVRKFTQCRGHAWPVVVERVLGEFASNADADRVFASSGVVYNLSDELGIDYKQVEQELLDLPEGQRSLARLLIAVYRNYASRHDAHGDTRIGDKTPWNAFHIGRLSKTFPSARYIHMVRDPRATVASYISNFNGIQRMTCDAAIARWVDSNRKILAFSQEQSSRIKVMRYEDIVADSNASVSAVAAFVGLRARADAKDVLHGDRLLPHYAKSFEPVAPDSLHKWRTILEPRQIRDVEHACASLMRVFGYPASGSLGHA